jgi:arginase
VLTVVGAPSSAGAYAPGQEDGPAALRAGGLLAALGPDVVDAGDVEGFRWRPDPERPRAANLSVVADRAGQVAKRVGAALEADGRVSCSAATARLVWARLRPLPSAMPG